MSDLRRELLEITRAAHAWVAWHEECGSDGLPAGDPPPARVPRVDARPQDARAPREEQPRPAFAPPPSRRDAPPPPEPRKAPAARSGAPALPIPSTPFEGPAPASAERRQRLAVLAEQVAPCTKCELAKARTQTVFSRGNPDAELMFVGEGPGADEDAQGEPFVGKAGQLLDKMIVGMGYARDDVYIANIVKCRPPGNRTP